MRAVVAISIAVMLGGCPRGLSKTDREALQDFRTVERACLAIAEELVRDYHLRLSDPDHLGTMVRAWLSIPWRGMRERFVAAKVGISEELARTFERYFEERAQAWENLSKVGNALGGIEPTKNHAAEFREQDAAAVADKVSADCCGADKLDLDELSFHQDSQY